MTYTPGATARYAWATVSPLACILLFTSSLASQSACPPGLPSGTHCETLRLPERPEQPSSRQIDIYVVRVPAKTPHALPDPALIVVGGPGQAASAMALFLVTRFDELRNERELILVDQRGTGGSNRLECRSSASADQSRLLGPVFTRDEIDECARTLAARADLNAYTTANAVLDLEAVRLRLGVSTWNLLAGSYGTKVALDYARRFPQATRALVLEGVAGPEYPNPLPHAAAGQAALDSVLLACERETRCNAAFGNVRMSLPQLWARLDSAPVPVEVPRRTGPPVMLERDNLAYGLHLLMFSNQTTPAVPFLLSRAIAGDYWPIANVLAQATTGLANQIDLGMQLSVTCMEDAPMYNEADIERETAGTYLRGSMARSSREECERWPVQPTTPLPVAEVHAPTLLLSGAYDAATPLQYARSVKSRLPNATSLLIPYGAHVTVDACVNGIIARYVRALELNPSDHACLALGRRLPFIIPGS